VLVVAMLLIVGAKLWKGAATITRDTHRIALADLHDLMRMDSDRG
jgi:hypothetical protein